MTAAIMMVTFNRLELTKQTLNSLIENTNHPFNLIVVDNNSADDTIDYLYRFCGDNLSNESNFKSFKIISNTKNLGIAVARNQALYLAEDEWLSTIDNDVILPKNWLGDCIDILKAIPKYGMIGVNLEERRYPLVKIGNFEFQEKVNGNLGTACTVFNKSLKKSLGYFNTEYGLYGEEDADFGMRIRVLGLRMGYLKCDGIHLGTGLQDVGKYREFKTAAHKANLQKFNENCRLYISRKKPLYIPYSSPK